MELTDVKPETIFNLKKVVIVRNKIKGGIKGKLHKITACEVAIQSADPELSIISETKKDLHNRDEDPMLKVNDCFLLPPE